MDKFFGVSKNGSTVRVEILAGITIFFATAYTVIVNPNNLSYGVSEIWNGVFVASCIGAAIGTLLMALYAKIPFAQAPGMGLSAVFAFTAMPAIAGVAGLANFGSDASDTISAYQMTLPIVFLSGVIFIIITAFGLREKIINGIPKNIKLAFGSGIGLFITLIGLKDSGIVQANPATFVSLENFGDLKYFGAAGDQGAQGVVAMGSILALVGTLIIGILFAKQIKGAVLIGILATTALTYIIQAASGVTMVPNAQVSSLGTVFGDFAKVSFFRMDFSTFSGGMIGAALGTLIALILAFFLVSLFDTMGTLFGVATSAGMVDKETGEVRGLKKGLLSDALGITAGAAAGSSTITTVVESSTGIGEGGRTGLTSLTTGILFIIAIFLAPFISLIPTVATAPALIFVGCLMMSGVKEVDFSDMTEALPAFFTIAIMPLTFSITNGVAFGLVSYVILKACTGKFKDLNVTMVIMCILFILQYVIS